MLTFLDVARMVDATVMMGVLGWGGGDVNVPWRCTHGRCYGNVGCLGPGVGVMLTFLDVARMVEATVITVPMAQIHRSSVFCHVLARAVACIRTAWTQLKVKEEKYVVPLTTCVIAKLLLMIMLIMMMMIMMMMMMSHDDDDVDVDDVTVKWWQCKKQVVFWNHNDTFSHATWCKIMVSLQRHAHFLSM